MSTSSEQHASAIRSQRIEKESGDKSPHSKEVLSLALALTVVCVAAKASLLPFPVSTLGEFLRWLLRLAVVVSPDICFVAGLAAIAFVVTRRFQPACYLAFILAGLYAVASVSIYRWTMVPLSLPSLWLAEGSTMTSSITACVGFGTWLVLAIIPIAFVTVLFLTRRFPRLDVLLKPRWAILALSLVAAYGLICRTYVHANWTDPNRWERRLAQNPHMVFVASCLEELFRGDWSELFDDPDESDFGRPPDRQDVRQLIERIPESDRPNNVVLIVLESTGVEYLSLYGSRHDTTPHLNRLVREGGVAFDNMYVQTPSSCRSLAALTASVYPWLDPWRRMLVRDRPGFAVPTIAEVLAERGYRTCFAHSGYWSWKNRDRFLRRRDGQKLVDASSLPAAKVNSWGVSDRAMFQATLDWIEESPEPFLLFAYTIETHHPYVAREPLRDFGVSDPDLNRYLNALRATDETLGWFMSELRRRGLDRSTLVAITSDHGESFGQHNQRIHSFAVYESAVHVPFVVLHKSVVRSLRDRLTGHGMTRPHLPTVCQHIDVAPTLLTLLGIDPPAAWQGRRLLTGDPAPDRRAYFFSNANETILGLRDGTYKYHYYLDSGHEELFDLANDPTEGNNIAAKHKGRCSQYQGRLGGFIRYQRRVHRRGP